MKINECIRCRTFPCGDVRHEGYLVPGVEIHPEQVAIVMISEAAPALVGLTNTGRRIPHRIHAPQ